ncbi:MAG: hypothetical protein QOD07_514 [Frankiaceae bacterium]|jgi:hypothetical protein|nr:hypothetical protein [Frankiaceae bacterium]
MTQSARRADAVATLFGDQGRLATRAQLGRLGVHSDTVRNHVAAGRWTALSRRVVLAQPGPLDDAQRRWFAVLDGGDGCVLAGLSALHALGLQGFPTERLQVAVPVTARGGRHDLYVRRRSHRLTADAVHPARRPLVMRASVALVDALEHMRLPLRGCALLAAVVQQRLLPAEALRPLLADERTLPHRGLYLAVAGDIEGGAHSLLELDFGRLARRAGIAPPRRQTVRLDAFGRRRYLDADFDGFAVEVDGAVHLRPLQWWDDMHRQNALVIAGKPILRFASVGVRNDSATVVAQLRAAARRWSR